MTASSGNLELYGSKSLFVRTSEVPGFWSSAASARVGVIQTQCPLLCASDSLAVTVQLAELNLNSSNLDCYSHPTSISFSSIKAGSGGAWQRWVGGMPSEQGNFCKLPC